MKSSGPNASSWGRGIIGRVSRFVLAVCETWYYPGPIL
jgi:hypothetical protein